MIYHNTEENTKENCLIKRKYPATQGRIAGYFSLLVSRWFLRGGDPRFCIEVFGLKYPPVQLTCRHTQQGLYTNAFLRYPIFHVFGGGK